MTVHALSRVGNALRLRAQLVRHRGDAVRCPVCDSAFDRFKDARNRGNALCWRCGSQERHRAQWLLFERRPELLHDARSLLHFAPEWCLRRRLSAVPGLRYVTADLDGTGVDLQLDVTRLALPDGAFDLVICSHVLEHVPDDAAAMAELRRVTAPGGRCLVMVPLALDRERTYEDAQVTAPADREREFLQADHVRLYAPDIADRLRAAGFDVEVVDLYAELGEQAERYRLLASDLIYVASPGDHPQGSAGKAAR
jgi:SAM-dependent methyltransferase